MHPVKTYLLVYFFLIISYWHSRTGWRNQLMPSTGRQQHESSDYSRPYFKVLHFARLSAHAWGSHARDLCFKCEVLNAWGLDVWSSSSASGISASRITRCHGLKIIAHNCLHGSTCYKVLNAWIPQVTLQFQATRLDIYICIKKSYIYACENVLIQGGLGRQVNV